jgi:hypothetical protein
MKDQPGRGHHRVAGGGVAGVGAGVAQRGGEGPRAWSQWSALVV